MSEELNKESLKSAINGLPEYGPDDNLWEKINDSLDFEEKVKPVISSLPSEIPDDFLWDKISSELGAEKKVFKIGFVRYAAAIAASVIIVFFSIKYFKSGIKSKETIEYSQEVVSPKDSTEQTDKYEQKAMEYIQESCNSQPDKCAMPDINALKNELQYLEKQDEMLQNAGARYGTDANMVKDQIKIENMKSKMIKELIQKLNS